MPLVQMLVEMQRRIPQIIDDKELLRLVRYLCKEQK